MPVEGTPRFNAIAVLEVGPIKFASNDIELVAKAAFVSTKDGKTYGSTTCRRWSQATLDKLAEFRASMEEDVANMVFERGPSAEQRTVAEPGGLGESLSLDAPSV